MSALTAPTQDMSAFSLTCKPTEPPDYRFLIITLLVTILVVANHAFGQASLPGTEESSKPEAAGTLLRLLDTALFTWGTRLFAALSIASAGWSLKEQRFGVAAISIVAAVIIATAPTWVRNLFDIGGGSIFS